MRAVEVVARALATAYVEGRIGADVNDRVDHDSSVRTYVDRRWIDHEPAAKRLLRALKDQPPHITDAGQGCYSVAGTINAIFEAMARA